jgi:putative nucleotidyltransferase with HDIG domain
MSSMAGVPMIANGETIGFIWVGRKSFIDESEIRPLMAIADIAASAIRRSILYEQTETQVRHLAALREIDIAITTSQDLSEIMKIVLKQTMSELHADAATLYVMNPDKLDMECICKEGFDISTYNWDILPLKDSLIGKAVTEKSIVQILDLAEARGPQWLVKEGFISYFAAPMIIKGEVKGAMEVFHRKKFTADREWLFFLEALAGQGAIAVDSVGMFQAIQRSNIELKFAYDSTIEGWSNALDLRDRETENHSKRVTDLTIELAFQFNIQEEDLRYIRWGALLHDIGKLGVPDSILLKEGKLTEEEWAIMRKHPENAYNLLKNIEYLRPALDIPYAHHEKWDGSGYPLGLKENEIPFSARLFAIADVWDALTNERVYRPAWPIEKTLEYIQENAGRHFDPKVVEVFMKLLMDYPQSSKKSARPAGSASGR